MATNISAYLKPSSLSTLYTATGKEIVSTILVSNTGANTTFTIYYVPNGQSVADTYAFPKGAAIVATDEIDFTRPITLSKGDTIQVSSASGNVSFALFGQSL